MRILLVVLALTLVAVPVAAQGPLLPTAHTGVCFIDTNGDGTRSLAEPVYLMVPACGVGVTSGDVRLTPNAGFPGGTIVSGAHDDTGRPGLAFAGQYAFFDENGDTTYSATEPLYVHVGALPGAIVPGDIPLTGSDAFQPIAGGDPRIARPLLAAPSAVGDETYAERDGLSGYTVGDNVLLDLDGNGLTTIGDLRLAVPAQTGSGGTTTSGTPTATATSSTSPTGTAPPSITSGAGQTGSGSSSTRDGPEPSTTPEAPEGSKGTPLPAWIIFLALGLALARRPSQ